MNRPQAWDLAAKLEEMIFGIVHGYSIKSREDVVAEFALALYEAFKADYDA